jgi:hypothetical protein
VAAHLEIKDEGATGLGWAISAKGPKTRLGQHETIGQTLEKMD